MLDKTFTPADIETRLYEGWESAGAFAANPTSDAAPYTIMIPPPNVTGSLHVGHALTMTLQDTLIRWRRMQGRDTLWQPGTDHAGIATQMVVERLLAEKQTTRQQLGRETFIDRVWEWKNESGGNITRQLRRLGASLDWARERFTMDDGLSDAVKEVFVSLHREGLIYRDRRLVNWDPHFQSAISDLEVDNKETRGSLWHIAYPIEGEAERRIIVATTRPETLLGDSAVAVHPQDPRYQDLIGRFVVLPLTGRRVPIIADEHSDPEKGTGAVKITPAHDFNDFAVGQRHNLPMPTILDAQGRITLEEIEGEIRAVARVADPAFTHSLVGQDRFAARKAIVAELERLGLLDKVEPHTLQVPHAERGGAVVEPRLTTQWFCNAAELAKPAIAAVENGDITFVPRQWENTFFAWMRDIQPWCISRQLWWGHRIPAWYGPDGQVFVAHSAREAEDAARRHYGSDQPLTQDEDVLDTWFSSALWPFSTLGWPLQTPELARYYPTDVLVTGFDIIFFWVARMMMMGLHFMKDVPFRTVYIHGLVRDERGQKMSKSRGNVIDPLELIEQYGTDALRFTICSLAGPGRDVKLGASRVENARSFVTKLWNAARFCHMNGIGPSTTFNPANVRSPLCRWAMAQANDAIAEATAALEAFRFNDYAAAGYRFTWNVFCDWLLEFAKPALASSADSSPEANEIRATIAYVLGIVLRLLHPMMPYVTEELWNRFGYGLAGSLINAPWPQPVAIEHEAQARDEVDWVVRFISEIRAVRAEMNVPPSLTMPVLVRDASDQTRQRLGAWADTLQRMARLTEASIFTGDLPKGATQAVLDEATLILPLAGIIDVAAEIARLRKEHAKVLGEIEKVVRKLENADFIQRAKPEVVDENRERLANFQQEATRLETAIQRASTAES